MKRMTSASVLEANGFAGDWYAFQVESLDLMGYARIGNFLYMVVFLRV